MAQSIKESIGKIEQLAAKQNGINVNLAYRPGEFVSNLVKDSEENRVNFETKQLGEIFEDMRAFENQNKDKIEALQKAAKEGKFDETILVKVNLGNTKELKERALLAPENWFKQQGLSFNLVEPASEDGLRYNVRWK